MIECQDCGTQVSESIGYCPRCGSRLPYKNKRHTGFRRRNLIAALLSLAMVCSVILLADYLNAPDKDNEWLHTNTPASTDAVDSKEMPGGSLKEEAWDKQLEAYLADGKKDLALQLLQEQLSAQGASAQLYGRAAERFIRHRYPAEAAAIWLEGMMETGARELAEELRQSVAPAEIIESGSLRRFLKTAYSKPAEQITWEDLYQLKSLSISEESISYLIESEDKEPDDAEASALLSMPLPRKFSDQPWATGELALFWGLRSLQWDVSANLLDERLLPALPDMKQLRLAYGFRQNPLAWASLSGVEELSLQGSGLESLEGIGQLPKLRKLELERTKVDNLEPLAALGGLESLTLRRNDLITSVEEVSQFSGLRELTLEGEELFMLQPLAKLTQLEALALHRTGTKDISFAVQLPALTSLTLDDNSKLSNLAPLARLTRLTHLELDAGPSDTLDVLAKLTNLESLKLRGMHDLSPLTHLKKLRSLELRRSSGTSDLRPLAGLAQLESLTLADNIGGIDEAAPIFKLGKLKRLRVLDSNVYGDMSGISALRELEELRIQNSEVHLKLASLTGLSKLKKLAINHSSLIYNVFIERQGFMTSYYYDDRNWDEELGQWKGLPQLETLELAGNKLTKLSFAARLGKLTHLNLEDNSITSIEPLLMLPQLRLADLRDNPVLDWSSADQMQDTVFLRTM
ncbi:leucine-rich repeat domain-containing protein [Paenibacillus dendritiformis]|uniref:leucine-rich repeat domain-containing protein n=1 Tax=Paenibacillus dendritiformis TaxID=130049 RepID=UPI001BCFDCC2|nr:leucine-rich repeat domain-containing protein [Paenibacillus dendritiformis]